MRRRILVTRTREDCERLQSLVAGAGIEIEPFPVLKMETVRDDAGWKDVAPLAGNQPPAASGWVLFASPRAARPFTDQVDELGLAALAAWPAAAVGPGTARAAEAAGFRVAVVGPGTGLGLAEALNARLDAPAVFVFACGEHRRRELPETLARAGHRVIPVVVYRMRATDPSEAPLPEGRIDGVVLTSPRSALMYLERLHGKPLPCRHWAMGPATRRAAAERGIECAVPARPTLESLAEELCTI